MRRTWASIVTLAAQLLLVGCYSTPKPKLAPPKRAEEYALPPSDDARWNKPVEYPKGTLNQDSVKHQQQHDPSQPPPIRSPNARMGAGPAGGGGF